MRPTPMSTRYKEAALCFSKRACVDAFAFVLEFKFALTKSATARERLCLYS